ncbi:MAG: WG repeat-containing protein [Oscillospiraceae bacterium]|nr:WG repeat-containing protein [Oscillospiraceae bacterium]
MLAKKDGHWGVIDTCGKVILPLVYDNICFLDRFGFVVQSRVENAVSFSIYCETGFPLIENLPAMPKRWEYGFQRWYFNNYICSESMPYNASFEVSCLYRWVKKSDDGMWYEHNGTYTVLRCIRGDESTPARIEKFGKPCKSFEEAELVLDAAFESTARILCDRAESRRWNGSGSCEQLPSATKDANICRVSAGFRWGYCDLWNDEVVQSPEWSFFEPFYRNEWNREDTRGIARFNAVPMDRYYTDEDSVSYHVFDPDGEQYNGRWGLIDSEGNFVVPPIYQYLSSQVGEYYIAKKDHLWGILDRNGNVVVPFSCTGICKCWVHEALFLLREGRDEGTRHTFLGYELEVLAENLPEIPETMHPRIAAMEAEEFCKSCLEDPIVPKVTEEERDQLISEQRNWAIRCRYRELYLSRDLMLKKMVQNLTELRASKETREKERFLTEVQGKLCRVYYAKCCGSFINPERYAVRYDSVPRHEFCDAVMTENGYIRIAEKTPFVCQNIVHYVTPGNAHRLGGTKEPYAFECDGQWGYCAGDGEILAYPVAGFCDGMPSPNNDSFYVNENPLMRFCLDAWTHLEIGDFCTGDPEGKKNECAGGRWGALDEDGTLIIPPIYQYLGRSGQSTELIIAKKNGFWGALDGSGDMVIPFVWDDIWLDVTYGCLAKKNTRYGARYAILDEEGTVLIGDLPSVPQHLDEYYDRSFQDGEEVRVLRCLMREVHEEDRVLMGHKRYSSHAEARDGMQGVFTDDEEEMDEE